MYRAYLQNNCLLWAFLFILGITGEGQSQSLVNEGNVADPIVEKLPDLMFDGSDEAHHRLRDAIHGARILADSGAGYEAAMVLTAISIQAKNTELAEEALNILNNLELTPNSVLNGTAKEILGKNQKRNHRHHSNFNKRHIQNLIKLGLYSEAADQLLRILKSNNERIIEQMWRELFRQSKTPEKLLAKNKLKINNQLAKELESANQRTLKLNQIRFLRVFDHETSEDAERLLRRSDPNIISENDRDEHHSEYQRWVERDNEENEDDRKEPPLEEIALRVVRHAGDMKNVCIKSSDFLAKLVIEAAPNSAAAKNARVLLGKSQEPNSKKLYHNLYMENDPGNEMFSEVKVREYELILTDQAIEKLHDEPKKYVRGTFREGEKVYRNVGIRLKGSGGSFQMLDQDTKPGFTIKFNQFVERQKFYGLRRIILNNANQDPSYMRESIGYSIFRDAGIPAPRTGYATLNVNGKSRGLYVQIEAVTQDFLARWFSNTKGNLYEGPGDIMEWDHLDLDSNQSNDDRRDLQQLAETIEEASDQDPWRTISKHVDFNCFKRFIALEQLVNHWDGYTQTNNYRIYHNPETSKFEFFPHGCDQLFEEAHANIFRNQGGILSRALIQTEAGREQYKETIRLLLDQVWDESTITSRIAEKYRLIRPYVSSGGRIGRGIDEFEETVNRMLRFVATRRYAAISQLISADSQNNWRQYREAEYHWLFDSYR